MKQGSNQRRSRGRNLNGGGRRNSRNHTFESNGPEVKVRGTAQQVLDKYLQLARDVQSGGDRGNAEAYLQFAEHYYRVLNVERDAEQADKRDGRTEGNEQKHGEGEPGVQRSNRHVSAPQNPRPQSASPEGQGEQALDKDKPAQSDQAEGGRAKGVRAPNAQGRGRRRKPNSAKPKNEATAAAEAAATNDAMSAEANVGAPVKKIETKVEGKISSSSSASKEPSSGDAKEAAANA